MNKSNRLMSDIVTFRTYAKYLSHVGRREIFAESINRNLNQHLEKFPQLSRDIINCFKQVHDYKVMPSMRSLQFGGEAIVKNNTRIYNCSFVHAAEVRTFCEILYLLLCGVGVGFSVQKHHIQQLPAIRNTKEENIYNVHDSIEGWAEALNQLMNAYFYGAIRPIFDFSNVRPKGSLLITSGAKAPGPEPLRQMLRMVEEKLKLARGRKLSSIEVHDIICMIADCVLAGGIRRAALISLFDRNDNDMLTAKHGEWWVKHPHRARANNSAILPRDLVTQEEFYHIFDMCIKSNSGEPGFSWTNDIETGFNPCHEINLNSHQFCNLTTTNVTALRDDRDLFKRVQSAALLGTLQASYTEFPYLSEKWKQVTEKEALLGCSFTGIADATGLSGSQLRAAAQIVLETNEKYAKKIGINPAARTTAIKPEGTASCVVGSSSGIHARFGQHYLRRVRMNKDDSLAKYLKSVVPELVEDDLFSSSGVVVTIPQESPEGSILRKNETALAALARVNFYNENWVQPGHRYGSNTHNVSCTINYKPEEVEQLRQEMWNTRHIYSGISLLPYDGGTYQQAPFEECDKATFDKLDVMVKEIDLTKVIELEDNTERINELACSGGSCEWTGGQK
jgi:ribonucleoside-triphosphate reductase